MVVHVHKQLSKGARVVLTARLALIDRDVLDLDRLLASARKQAQIGEGRTAELLLVGARHELDPRSVKRVREALGLKWSDLPGPMSRA